MCASWPASLSRLRRHGGRKETRNMADSDEHDMADDEPTAAGGSNSGKGKVDRDGTGRRLKGRGVAGSSTTMDEGGSYDSIPAKGGARGPLKCKPRSHPRAPAPFRVPLPPSAALVDALLPVHRSWQRSRVGSSS